MVVEHYQNLLPRLSRVDIFANERDGHNFDSTLDPGILAEEIRGCLIEEFRFEIASNFGEFETFSDEKPDFGSVTCRERGDPRRQGV